MQTLSTKMNNRGMTGRPVYTNLVGALSAALLLGCQIAAQAALGGAVYDWGNNTLGQAPLTPPFSTSTNVVAVAGGVNHSLALKNNGTVVAWGDRSGGQTNVPTSITNAIAIGGGTLYSMALRANGTVAVWGNIQSPPANLSNVVAIAAGWAHCLALKNDGTVVAWGANSAGQTNVPAGLTNVAAIAAGDSFSLALLKDGTVTAWGDGAFDKTTVPAGLTNVVAIAAGQNHVLALRNDGTVTTWGDDTYGQCDLPTLSKRIIQLSAGARHSMALLADGTLAAWGDNTYGQATVGPTIAGFFTVAAGGYHCLTVHGDGSPVIMVQPLSQAIQIDTPVLFSVLAGGNQPLSYQWRKNGTNISGATLSSYTIADVLPASAGSYTVLVSNAVGSVVSAAAVLTPYGVPPVITLEPQGTNVLCAQSATFTVAATGPRPLSYQWRLGGTALKNATSTSLVINPALNANAGNYDCVVTNLYGSVTSDVATLIVSMDPIVLQPHDTNVICGQTATFSVALLGPAPITYQWYFNGTNLPGATASTLVINNALNANVGAYYVVATCQCGSTNSAIAYLNVAIDPITLQPTDTNAVCGTAASFQVAVQGPPPIAYQWQWYGTNLVGATSNVLFFNPVLSSNAGPYNVVITCQCGSTNSAVANLTVTALPPTITSPLAETAAQGAPFTYQITALQNPIGYNATPLPRGLSVDTTNGIISGTNYDVGTFGIHITAYNACASDTETLILTNYSSAPLITSPLVAYGVEAADFSYTITVTNAPVVFGAANLPIGLVLDPTTGIIAGQPAYAGNFSSTLFATNAWGWTTANLLIVISNAPIAGLNITTVSTNYSSPYLLDFQFALTGNTVDDPTITKPFVADTSLLSVQAFEDANQVIPDETAFILKLLSPSAIKLKAALVLDFTESIADPALNGDTNGDGISDALDAEVASAITFVRQQPAAAQIGVFEFHRDDVAPAQVIGITNDQAGVVGAIAGIYTNYVNGFSSGTRAWDALGMAISALGTNSDPSAQSCIVVVTDGDDNASTNTLNAVIQAATNSNVKIYAVGFGYNINTANLANLTSKTGGAYYTGTNGVQMASEFAQIGKALTGMYRLRWATTQRGSKAFQPSFVIGYGGFWATSPPNPTITLSNYIMVVDTNGPTTNYYSDYSKIQPPPTSSNIVSTNTATNLSYTISPYKPTTYAGDVTRGTLHLGGTPGVQPAGVSLTADYIPRYIRQFLVHYRANWPCTVAISTNPGALLTNWTMVAAPDGSNGTYVTISSPSPTNNTGLNTSLTFGDWGDLLSFQFYDVVPTNNTFALFQVVTNIYALSNHILGYVGQSFAVSNAPGFTTNYPALPFGTPVPWLLAYGITSNWTNAEITDFDGDGMLTWQEYVANTNPTNAASIFGIKTLVQTQYGGLYQVTFPSAINRYYTLLSSTDLATWTVVQDNIPGTGADVTVVDTRYITSPKVFYRIQVHL